VIIVLGLYLPTSRLAKRAWLLLFLAISAFYLYGLGFLPLVGPDEPRYAEVAREMFVRRDFITPTLGGVPWFEKPPLLYWLMMASYRVFGVSEFSARLGPALCGLATAAFVWWMARSVPIAEWHGENKSKFANWSTLVFLSSTGAIVFSRAASFDIVLTMTLTGAFSCFFVWDLRTKSNFASGKHRNLLAGFYFLLGLSLLAKGLVGVVVALLVISAFYLFRSEWPPHALFKSLVWGIPIVLAVAGVWYGAMLYRYGWLFFDQFIVQHHFARFLTNKYHHPQPFYFYLPILALLALPWTLVLAGSILSLRLRDLRANSPRDRLRLFSLIVVVAVVVPFSVSGSKLPAYILPCLPAVALLVAERLEVFRLKHRGENSIRLTGVLFVSVGAGAAWYLTRLAWLPRACVIAGAAAAVAVGLFALVYSRQRTAVFLLFACCALGITGLAIHCSAPVAARESVRDLVRLASARGYGNVPIVGLHTVERSAEFYAAGTLAYGADGEPVKFEGAADVIDAARRSGGLIMCFVPTEFASQLTGYPGAQTEVIGNNGQVSLVVVRVMRS
jgi:4-amino-4-deoxy-L-arabinose transferase-like glycosyltransferase